MGIPSPPFENKPSFKHQNIKHQKTTEFPTGWLSLLWSSCKRRAQRWCLEMESSRPAGIYVYFITEKPFWIRGTDFQATCGGLAGNTGRSFCSESQAASVANSRHQARSLRCLGTMCGQSLLTHRPEASQVLPSTQPVMLFIKALERHTGN